MFEAQGVSYTTCRHNPVHSRALFTKRRCSAVIDLSRCRDTLMLLQKAHPCAP